MNTVAPTNQPRIKFEKIQLNNSLESILDEDVPYSIVVENIIVGVTRDIFAIPYIFFYIFNLEYPKKLEATFLLIEKLFLRISDKCKVLSKV